MSAAAPDLSRPRGITAALIGSGIGPSLTPAMHEQEAEALGMRCVYRRLDLDVLGREASAVGDLVRAARDAGFDGVNVTHPCKQLVIGHLDELSPDAEALGAVNTVVFTGGRMVGHNSDWSGFARALDGGLPGAPLGRVVLLGAGGAGAAVAHALVVRGVRELVVLDVDASRADALARALTDRSGAGRARGGDLARLAQEEGAADGLVHATPTGMAAHPGSAVPAQLLRPDLWVADVVYRPLETELVRTARERGCAVLDGGGMAVGQAVDAFRLFTGVEPDAGRMAAHFAALVAAEQG